MLRRVRNCLILLLLLLLLQTLSNHGRSQRRSFGDVLGLTYPTTGIKQETVRKLHGLKGKKCYLA